MVDTIGVGLIGCGGIGQIHASALASLAAEGGVLIHPVAAADPSVQAREAAARNWAFARLTAEPESVLRDPDVDAVIVCTPTHTHRELVLGTLAAGKHLYAEKPLAPSFAEVRELCDAVTGSDVVAQVGFQMRTHALLARVKSIADSGALGPPMAYSLRDDEAFPTTALDRNRSDWRSKRASAGGGTLLEHSIHGIDLLSWIFGQPLRVAATTRALLGFDVEDTAALMIEHDSGMVGTLVSIYGGVVGREESRLEVYFRDGIVEVTWGVLVEAPEHSFRIQRAGEPAEHLDPVAILDEHLAGLGVSNRPFFYQHLAHRAFFRSIAQGEPASPSFADALVAHATVEAGYRAASRGSAVTLAEVLARP